MQKQAPTLGRLLTMVLFALSCFGLLLFLWLAFGGPIPLKPKGYRVFVAIPEANQLSIEADIRASGVSIGKIREKERLPGGNMTLVGMELDRAAAPLDADARVIMRSKTILGEKYLEITRGTPGGPQIPEGGRLPSAQVEETVELDEVLGILDPTTRNLFRTWQQEQGGAAKESGKSLSDALGTLPRFVASGTDVLEVLDRQADDVRRLTRNTGRVFGALTENESQLTNLVTSFDQVFESTARRQEALRQTFAIFPTFLDESKATAENLETFAQLARPVISDLRPAIQDLRPTLRDARAFAPDLERFVKSLDPLITVSKEGLPALSETLRGLKPVLASLGQFLGEFNPIVQYLENSQYQVSDFLHNGAAAIADVTTSPGGGIGHYLRQIGVFGSESLAIYPERQSSNRGNTYLKAGELNPSPTLAKHQMFANWDCKPSGGTVEGNDDANILGCWVGPNMVFQNKLQGKFPHVEANDYSK